MRPSAQLRTPSPSTFQLRPVCVALALSLAGMAHASSSGLVISQAYGGGQATSGSPSYKQDYVELFNAGSSNVSLVGLSLQYAAATGNFNGVTNLGTGTVTSLAPGQYALVALAAGSLGPNLPTADITGSTAASASNGKFALVSGTTALGCGATALACTTSQQAQIIDLVSYGTVSLSEGSAVGVLDSAKAAVRNNNGCTDTGNNGTDFSIAAPAPRNSATAALPNPASAQCACSCGNSRRSIA